MEKAFYLVLILLVVASSSLAQQRPELVKATDVDFCDLIHRPADYDQKVLRVKTLYIVGFEGSIFNKQDCGIGDIWVKFDAGYEKATDRKILQKFNKLTDTRPEKTAGGGTNWPTRMVEVVVVGRFDGVKRTHKLGTSTRSQGFGHLGAFDSQFTVLAIEAVTAVPKPKS
jgi:hypothetical protein